MAQYNKRKRDGAPHLPPTQADPNEIREHKLYIGNLDKRVTEYHIIKLFQPHGKIVREQFMWHASGPQRGQPRGFAFVEFENRVQALAAKASLDAKTLFGRRLTVRFVQAKLAEGLTDAGAAGGDGSSSAGAAAGAGADGMGGADDSMGAAQQAAEAASSMDSAMAALRRKLGLAPGQSARSLGTPTAISALTPQSVSAAAGEGRGGGGPRSSALGQAKSRLLQRRKDEEATARSAPAEAAQDQEGNTGATDSNKRARLASEAANDR